MKPTICSPSLRKGIPLTSLPLEPAALDSADRLRDEILSGVGNRDASMNQLKDLVARHADTLPGWAAMGEIARAGGETLNVYAYFRVAYHRGLDKARASDWRGDGHIPWEIPANWPFLRAIHGLAQCADALGESTEAKRCGDFWGTLAPSHPF